MIFSRLTLGLHMLEQDVHCIVVFKSFRLCFVFLIYFSEVRPSVENRVISQELKNSHQGRQRAYLKKLSSQFSDLVKRSYLGLHILEQDTHCIIDFWNNHDFLFFECWKDQNSIWQSAIYLYQSWLSCLMTLYTVWVGFPRASTKPFNEYFCLNLAAYCTSHK